MMAVVAGVRGPKQLRYCGCGRFTLQLVGSFHEYDDDGNVSKEPTEFSHLPLCPICEDEEKRKEKAA